MNTEPASGKSGGLQDSSTDKNQFTDLDISTAALVANDDGTFRFSLKALEMENQHIEIVPISQNEVKNILAKEKPVKKILVPKSKVFKRKTYECELCGKHLSCSTSLSRHKQYHKAEKPYVCQVCNRGFKDSSNLKKHTLIHKREFACHMCKRSFLHKSLLAAHLRHHESRSTFIKNGNSSEEVIVKTVVQSDGTHLEIVSMKCLENFSFETQGKKFTSVGSTAGEHLISDMESEVQADSVIGCQRAPGDIARMYQCGHCGKETIQRGNIMRHLLHHLRKTLFSCQVCHKNFMSKGELVKHESSHIRPYKFSKCNGTFSSNKFRGKLALKLHLKERQTKKQNKMYKSFKVGIDQMENCVANESVSENGLLNEENAKQAESQNSNRQWYLNAQETDSLNEVFGTEKMSTECLEKEVNKSSQFSNASKRYSCGICQSKFERLKSLSDHLKSHKVREDQISVQNQDIPLRECSFISTGRTQKESIEIEANRKNQDNNSHRLYSCALCQNRFDSLKYLSKHLRSHVIKEDGNTAINVPEQEGHILKDLTTLHAPGDTNGSSVKERPSVYKCASKTFAPVSVSNGINEIYENSTTTALRKVLDFDATCSENLITKAVGRHAFLSGTTSKNDEVEWNIDSALEDTFTLSSTQSSEQTLASINDFYVIASSMEQYNQGNGLESSNLHETCPKEANQIQTQDFSTPLTSSLSNNQLRKLKSASNCEKSQNVGEPVSKICPENSYEKKGLGRNVPVIKQYPQISSTTETKSVQIVSYLKNSKNVKKSLPLPNEPILEGPRKKKLKLKESKSTSVQGKTNQETLLRTEAPVSRRTKFLKSSFKC